MASNPAQGRPASPLTLSARVNRRKQRARATKNGGGNLWERVRSKREDLVNEARAEREKSNAQTNTGRTRFEQVVKDALAARAEQENDKEKNRNVSPIRSSPESLQNFREDDVYSPLLDSPKKTDNHQKEIQAVIKKAGQDIVDNNGRPYGEPKITPRVRVREPNRPLRARAEYRPPQARNPTPAKWPTTFGMDMTTDETNHKPEEYDDWQDGKSLKECNLYMLTYEIDCDVTFLVGENKEAIRCHKYILLSRNSKFSKILQRFRGEIDTLLAVPDIQPDIFRELITYFYTDEIELNVRLATVLLHPTYKFGVTSLLRKCFEYLLSEMSSDNVCKIMESAHTYNEQNIFDKCLRFIFVNAVDVLKVPNFRDLCKECVTEVVKSDDLLADETQVYDALMNWANGECARNPRKLQLSDSNRREVLGDMLFYVRFPLIDVNVFSHRISKANVLRADEKIALFQYFHGEINILPEKFNRKQRRKYSIKKELLARADDNYDVDRSFASPQGQKYGRRPILPIEAGDSNTDQFTRQTPSYDNVYIEPEQPVLRVIRYKGIAGPWNLNSPDAISFRCSNTIIFRGVQVFGPYTGTDYYDVTISLFDEFRNELRREQMNIFTNKAKVYDVMLTQPVRIPKQRIFTAQIIMKGKPTIQGNGGIATVVTEDIQFEFINSNRSLNGTDVTTGQIPALLFSKP